MGLDSLLMGCKDSAEKVHFVRYGVCVKECEDAWVAGLQVYPC